MEIEIVRCKTGNFAQNLEGLFTSLRNLAALQPVKDYVAFACLTLFPILTCWKTFYIQNIGERF